MKKIKQLIYAAALLGCAVSCAKEDPLPDATQQGLNTFGCNIDGVAWIPTGTSGPGGTKPVSASLRQDGEINVSGNSPRQLFDVVAQLGNKRNIGEYNLGDSNNGSYGYFSDDKTSYLTDKTNIGKLTIIRLDTLKRIFSGTFYFKAKDRNSSKVIDISNGRFDVSY